MDVIHVLLLIMGFIQLVSRTPWRSSEVTFLTLSQLSGWAAGLLQLAALLLIYLGTPDRQEGSSDPPP